MNNSCVHIKASAISCAPFLHAITKNASLHVSASLVCGVGLNYCALLVDEGYVLVDKGDTYESVLVKKY